MLKRWMILLLLPLQFLAFPLFGNPYLVQFTDSLCSGDTGYLTIASNGNFQVDSIEFTGNGITILNDSSISFAPLSTSYYYFIVYSQGFDMEDSIQVVVIPPPVAFFFLSEDTICSNELVSGVNTSAFWTESQWFAGPALIAQTPGFTQSFSNVGAVPLQVPISLVVSNSLGCSDSLQQVLVVLPGPDPINFDTYPAGYFTNCLEEDSFEVNIFNISATLSSNTLYEIDWGNGNTQNLINWPASNPVSNFYTESGMYFIQVTISNAFGCQAQSSHYVFYGSNPSITLGNPGNTTLLCAPRTYYFPLYYTNLQGEENPDGTIYTITFNDGSPDMIFSHPPPDTLVHTYYHSSCGTSAGNYLNAFNIKVLAENPCGSSSSTVEPIVLKNQTDAEFSMSDQGPVCPDDTVVITQLTASGNNANYSGGAYVCDTNFVFNWNISPSIGWTLLSGSLGTSPLNFNTFPFFNSGSQELEISFQQAGTYIISLSADNSCNPQSAFVDTIVVLEVPVMDISVTPVIGCTPLTVQTTNNSQGDGMQHNWSVSPGNGVSFISGNSSSLSPSFLFTQAGNFTIEYTMLNTCRELDTLIGIQVQSAPDVLGLTPLHVCVEDTLVTFMDYEDNYAPINNYAWNISPTSNYSLVNSSLNQANLQLTFSLPGTYQLVSLATNVCGTDSFVTQAIVEALPVFNLLADSILCMGEQSTISVQFVNPPSYASFQWSTGQTGNSISLQPYDNQVVGLVITSAAQCVYSRDISFTVYPLPIVNAGLNQSYCLDAANDTLQGLPAGGSWSVVSGASGVSAAGVLQASVLGVGLESLTYTWQDPTTSCSNSDQMQVTVYDLPQVNAGADSLFCNQPIVATLQGFTPSGGIWSGPNLSNMNTGSFIPNGVDTITYVYTFTDNHGCISSDSMQAFIINPTPADAGSDLAVCVGSAALSLSGYPTPGSWSGSTVSTGGIYNPLAAGTFQLFYEVGVGTCYSKDTLQLTVYALPSVNAGLNQSYCLDAVNDTLQGLPAGGSWSVVSGASGVSAAGVLQASVLGVGPENLTYTWQDPTTSCSNTDQMLVTVYDLPQVNAGADSLFCNQPIAATLQGFTPSGGIWSGPNLSNTSTGSFIPNGADTITYVYTYSDSHGCISSDSMQVFIINPTPADAGSDQAVCVGSAALSLSGYPTPGSWSGSTVTTGGIYNPLAAGTFQLFYEVGVGTCYSKDTLQLTVYALPAVNAGPNQSYCLDAVNDTLQGLPAGGSWSVVSGASGVSAAGVLQASVLGVGLESLTYTWQDPTTSCSNTDQMLVTVYDLPQVNAGADSLFCNQPIAATLQGFTPSGGIWSGPNLSNVNTGSFIPNGVDTITYVYTFTDSHGCISSDSMQAFIINPTPANAGSDQAVCVGSAALSLSGYPTPGSWSGSTVTTGGIYNPLAAGTFTLFYEVGVGTCYSKDTLQLTVYALPVVNAGLNQSYCLDAANDTLQGLPAGGSWAVVSGASGVSAAGVLQASVLGVGLESLTYTWQDPTTSCSNTDQMLVTVYDLPQVHAGADSLFCNQPIAATLQGFTPSGGIWSGPNLSNTSTGSFIPNGADTITYVYTYSDSHGCISSDSMQAFIINPTPADAGSDQAVCVGSSALSLNGYPTPGSWSGSTVTTGGIYNPLAAGTFTLFYEIGVGTCYSKDTMQLTVYALPSVNAGPNQSYCLDAANDTLQGLPAGGSWSVVSGASGVSAAGVLQASVLGVGLESLTYTWQDPTTSCSNTDQMLVTVYDLPQVNAGADSLFCNQPIAATLQGFTPSGGIWSGPNLSNVTTGSFIPNGVDTITYVYTYSDSHGCISSDSLQAFIINPTPADAGSDQAVCVGSTALSLSGYPTPGSWSGSTVTAGGTYNPLAAGTFQLFYEVGVGTCYSKDTLQLTVYALPTVNAGLNQSYCLDAANDTLQGLPAGGSWSVVSGASGVSTAGVLQASVLGVGPESLTYTWQDPTTSCSNTDQMLVTIYDLPVVNAGADSLFCNQPIAATLQGFTPSGGIWSGPNLSNVNTGSFIPNGVDTITYVYTFSDGHGCINSDSMQAIIIEPIPADAGSDQAVCVGSAALSLSGYPTPGSWSGSTVTAGGTYNPLAAGTFQLFYEVGVGTCYSKDTMQLIVHPLPVVNAGSDANRCIDAQPENLVGAPSNGSWSGTGITIPGVGLFEPQAAGLGPHLLVYHYTNPITTCSNTDTMQMYIRPLPVAGFLLDSILCINGTDLTPANTSVGANFYQWYINDSLISQLLSPQLNFPDTGFFQVSLATQTLYGCSDSADMLVQVLGLPEAYFIMEPDSGCEPLTVGFLNLSIGHSHSSFWRFGNGEESIQPNPQDVTYSINGMQDAYFFIILSEKNQCGKDEYTDSVHVYSTPSIDFDLMAATGCEPYLVDLSSVYVDIPLSIHWEFGDGQQANSMVADHLYVQDGQYTLSATIWGPVGCIDPAGEEHQIQVEVLNKPEIMVSPDYQLVCENYNARITASGADFYVGYDELGTELLFDKDILSLQPADTTQIQIVGTTDEGCKDTCQALIDVERMPYFTLGNDTCLKVNEQIELSTQNPGVTSHWNTGDSTSTLLVTEPSMESICVTLIPEVCPSITDCIFIDYCPLIDLPSAFSPNGDGVNDRLRVMYHQIQSIDFKIYSRWGKLVYHSHSLAEGWDGTFEGIPQVMEVYLYTIEAITNAGEIIQKTGNVSLLR